jgi:hypothetical protein
MVAREAVWDLTVAALPAMVLAALLFTFTAQTSFAQKAASAPEVAEKRADLEGATQAGLHAFLLDRPHLTLASLAENLLSHDDSCLHAPATGVLKRPQNERG